MREFDRMITLLEKCGPRYSERELARITNELLKLLQPLRREPQEILMREKKDENVYLRVHHSITVKYYFPDINVRYKSQLTPKIQVKVIKRYGKQIEVRDAIKDHWNKLLDFIHRWQIPKQVGRITILGNEVIAAYNTSPFVLLCREDKPVLGNDVRLYLDNALLDVLEEMTGEILEKTEAVRVANEKLKDHIRKEFRGLMISKRV